MKENGHVVAILGGGFCGALTAFHLIGKLRESSQASISARIVLVDKDYLSSRTFLGRGLAYKEQSNSQLLNVPAGNMSIFDDQPLHFYHWYVARYPQSCITTDSFLPRSAYGEYINETISATIKSAVASGIVQIVSEQANSLKKIVRDGQSLFLLGTSDQQIFCNQLILATGNTLPQPLKSESGQEIVLETPLTFAPQSIASSTGNVLFIGSGLTMIDQILRLEELGFNGNYIAVSRHGLLPQSHGRAKLQTQSDFDFNNFRAQMLTMTLSQRLSSFREIVTDGPEVRVKPSWRHLMDSLRPVSVTLWQSLTKQEQSRFLRHLRPYWDVHRHRVPLNIAQMLEDLKLSGRLRVIAGKLEAITSGGSAGGLNAEIKKRGEPVSIFIQMAAAINCTGPDLNFSGHGCKDVLMVSAERNGLVSACSLGLGLDSLGFQLLDKEGQPVAGLWAVGSLLKSSFWESTAVPELRSQTSALAALVYRQIELVNHLHQNKITSGSVSA